MDRARENAFDWFALAYAQDSQTNAWNALYERPAALSLLGDVAGLRVLDAGCGPGAHAAVLLQREDAPRRMIARRGPRRADPTARGTIACDQMPGGGCLPRIRLAAAIFMQH